MSHSEFDRHQHWENIYQTKALSEVGWHQPKPEVSLGFISRLNIPKDAAIIDIGGGDSFLIDNLLFKGYTDLTVLDISATAIQRAKQRLGEFADQVNWIESDITEFRPTRQYDLWHDRATFHFLTGAEEVDLYIQALELGSKPSGNLVVGTFSENGPTKCSGIEIKQYSPETLTEQFGNKFSTLECVIHDHITPFETAQNYVFCSFQKKTDN